MTALRVGRTMDHCRVLGPGARAVIWVAGCRLRCRECMTPELLDFRAGAEVPVAELGAWVAGLRDIAGLTISGGEPFEQPAALSELLDLARADRPGLTAMVFTGYTVEQLRAGTAAQQKLLERLDIVVDGPYLPERHCTERWRGSDNQRVHWLTPHSACNPQDMSHSAGVEVLVEASGAFTVTGVPPTRGFRRELRTRLAAQGIRVATKETS